MGVPMNMNSKPPCPSDHGMPQQVTAIRIPPLRNSIALGFTTISSRALIRWAIKPSAQQCFPHSLISRLRVHPDFCDIGEYREISALDLGTALSVMPQQPVWFQHVQSTCLQVWKAIYAQADFRMADEELKKQFVDYFMVSEFEVLSSPEYGVLSGFSWVAQSGMEGRLKGKMEFRAADSTLHELILPLDALLAWISPAAMDHYDGALYNLDTYLPLVGPMARPESPDPQGGFTTSTPALPPLLPPTSDEPNLDTQSIPVASGGRGKGGEKGSGGMGMGMFAQEGGMGSDEERGPAASIPELVGDHANTSVQSTNDKIAGDCPRKRIAAACYSCRLREIRFSGANPSQDGRCNQCHQRNQECVFDSPYACSICGRRFARKWNLLRHFKRKHAQGPPNAPL
ncbi:predicted protein [Uncinocarpus reesii 1704]|uniref:C2H2-type domain-containing protein n=1 Tax=Uncinocarpus reesii (strain UAMH 1704) TaxID=336963 RepID=C4K090_UNCRE|nr:uncharacterized protein UREG_07904 [Uncinocarpus reesii 1704]EEP83039.1 predicted protein [Uncinocarpus reesii 1704]